MEKGVGGGIPRRCLKVLFCGRLAYYRCLEAVKSFVESYLRSLESSFESYLGLRGGYLRFPEGGTSGLDLWKNRLRTDPGNFLYENIWFSAINVFFYIKNKGLGAICPCLAPPVLVPNPGKGTHGKVPYNFNMVFDLEVHNHIKSYGF